MRDFHIPKIPATTNKSIRFPNDVIDKVEEAIRGTDCTFSAFVVEAVRVALENLQEQKERAQQESKGKALRVLAGGLFCCQANKKRRGWCLSAFLFLGKALSLPCRCSGYRGR